jgi:hypothetical protein
MTGHQPPTGQDDSGSSGSVRAPAPDYDLFLSYATHPDFQLARDLESFLENFHKLSPSAGPRLRELRICRDGSDFQLRRSAELTPDSDGSLSILTSYLSRSQWLLVICSTGARHSKWMPREIQWFLDSRPDRILVAVSEGADPASDPSTIFTPQLIAAGIPRSQFWYDFRGYYRGKARRSVAVRSFDDERTRLAADILGQPVDVVRPIWFREQQRLARRKTILATVAAMVFGILFSLAMWFRSVAEQRATVLEQSLAVAEARSNRITSPVTASRRLLGALQRPAAEAERVTQQAKQLAIELLASSTGTPRFWLTGRYDQFKVREGSAWTVAWGRQGAAILNLEEPAQVAYVREPILKANFIREGVLLETDRGRAYLFETIGAKVNTPKILSNWSRLMAIHWDSRRIAGILHDSTKVWDLAGNHAVITPQPGSEADLQSMAPVEMHVAPDVPESWRLLDMVTRQYGPKVRAAAFSLDTRFAATISHEGELVIWRVHGARVSRVAARQGLTCQDPRFLGNSHLLVDRQVIEVGDDGFGPSRNVTFDGPLLAAGPSSPVLVIANQQYVAEDMYENGPTCQLVDFRGNQTSNYELRGHTGSIMCALVTGDGHHVVTGGEDKRVLVWSLDSPSTPIADFSMHDASVVGLVTVGTALYSVSSDGMVRATEMSAILAPTLPYKLSSTSQAPSRPGIVSVSPNGRHLLYASDHCALIDLSGNARLTQRTPIPSMADVRWVAWRDDSARAVAVGSDGSVREITVEGARATVLWRPTATDRACIFAQYLPRTDALLTVEKSTAGVTANVRARHDPTVSQEIATIAAPPDPDSTVATFFRHSCLCLFPEGSDDEPRDAVVVALDRMSSTSSLKATVPLRSGNGRAIADFSYVHGSDRLVLLSFDAPPRAVDASMRVEWHIRGQAPRLWRSDVALEPRPNGYWDEDAAPLPRCELSNDGQWALVGRNDAEATLWSLDAGRAKAQRVLLTYTPRAMRMDRFAASAWTNAFASDSKHLVLHDEHGQAMVLRLRDDTPPAKVLDLPSGPSFPQRRSNAVPRVEFSLDGRWVIWLADEVRIWDLSASDVSASELRVPGAYDEHNYHYISFVGNTDDFSRFFLTLCPDVTSDGRFLLLKTLSDWRIVPIGVTDLSDLLLESVGIDGSR